MRARHLVTRPAQRVALRGRLLRPYRRARFGSFGERSVIHRPLWIFGPQHMAVGAHVLILHSAWLSVESRAWKGSDVVLRIGDRVGIRPFCTVSAAESITIEDDVIIGAYSSVVDNDHTFAAGRPNVMHNPVATAPVRIGRGTWIAERVAVLRGSDIGECCIIGANSVVRGTIPPYSIAVGAPARVVGRVEGVDAGAASHLDRLY